MRSVSEPCGDEVAPRFPIGFRSSDQEFAARFLSEPMQAHPVPQDHLCDVRHSCLATAVGVSSIVAHLTPAAALGRRFVLQTRSRVCSRDNFKSEDILESALYEFLLLLVLDFGEHEYPDQQSNKALRQFSQCCQKASESPSQQNAT